MRVCSALTSSKKVPAGSRTSFKQRYGIVGKGSNGESPSINKQGADERLLENVPEILGRYTVQDIYNVDESSLFYQMLPCHGGKQSKQRPTLLLCVNMDGSDKCDPLIIGNTENHKGVKKLSASVRVEHQSLDEPRDLLGVAKKLRRRHGPPKESCVSAVGQLQSAPHPGASPEECEVAVLSPQCDFRHPSP